MVATRRGARVVESPSKTNSDEPSNVTVTGTSTRRTRRGVAKDDNQPLSGSDNDVQRTTPGVTVTIADQEEKPLEEAKLHDDIPTKLVDVKDSDAESCCSIQSGARTPSRRSTRRRGQLQACGKPTNSSPGGVSEAESCASVSSTPGAALRRSSRKQRAKATHDHNDNEDSHAGADEDVSEAESCSSVSSLRKRTTSRALTRSKKKTSPGPQASNTEDTEMSEQDTKEQGTSTARRSTRGRRARGNVQPLPMDLEDSGDVSSSSTSRRPPTRRTRAAPAEEPEPGVAEEEPGKSSRRSTRSRQRGAGRGRSDSESDAPNYSPVGSPLGSAVGNSTPCSSRTSSASSHRAVPVTKVTRSLRKDVLIASSSLATVVGGRGVLVTDQGDAPQSDAMETGEEHETTVTEAEEDQTLVAMEEEEDAAVVEVNEAATSESVQDAIGPDSSHPDEDMGGVTSTIEEAAEPLDQQDGLSTMQEGAIEQSQAAEPEDSHSNVRVTVEADDKKECPLDGTSEHIEPEGSKSGVTLEAEEVCVASFDAATSLQQAPSVSLVAEEATTSTQVCVGSSSQVSVSALSDSTDVQADSSTKEEEAPSATTEVPTAPSGQDLNSISSDTSASAEGAVQDETEEEEKQTVACPQGPSAEAVSDEDEAHDEEEEDEEAQPMEVDGTEPTCASLAEHDQPSSSQPSQRPVVSLLDSSDEDDDEEQDSDADSLVEERPTGTAQASESEEEEEDEEATGPTRSRPVVKELSDGGLFVIDTAPGMDSEGTLFMETRGTETDEPKTGEVAEEEEFVDEEEEEEDEDTQILYSSRSAASKEFPCRIDPGLRMRELGGLYISLDGGKAKPTASSTSSSSLQTLRLNELMKKSIMTPDFEKKESVPPFKESRNAAKRERRVERAKTTGEGWYNMKAPEMTDELKNDLKVIQMRSAMDPKRFYKKNDRDGFSKYVQVGTVVDSPLDFYHSRVPKKERKRTIVEELLADAEFRRYNKKKYQELVSEKSALLAGKKRWKKNKHKSKAN